ncbi:MAG: class IV adenylate cyclase [Desulfovibrio sp.]|jgi:adenylate cyclase class 2|nr:class IV adenylate cyclase [Desulfovibrio sp.]
MTWEIEQKYLHVDFRNLRRALKKHGACFDGAHLEQNIVFDTRDALLFEAGHLLRLRAQCRPDRKLYLLTLKLPPHAGKTLAGVREDFKIREEREVNVADGTALSAILEGLGYTEKIFYEKLREVWSLGRVEVCLDELPFIKAVELEGAPDCIQRVARLLELDKETASGKNYHEIHQEWRRRQGMPQERSFVFGGERRSQLQKKFGFAWENGDGNTSGR